MSELRRHTPLKRSPMKRTGHALARTAMPKSSGKSPTDWSPSVRAAAVARSGGWCEFPECDKQATNLHHRLRRERPGADCVDNAMHLCALHHTFVHSVGREAYVRGWLLRTGDPIAPLTR